MNSGPLLKYIEKNTGPLLLYNVPIKVQYIINVGFLIVNLKKNTGPSTIKPKKKAGPIKNKYVILSREWILDPHWNIKKKTLET